MPEVSIIIVSMNRPDNLCPCLDSIREHTAVSYETFVVAYMFDKTSLSRLKEAYPWVTWVESDEPRGFSENNNLALRKASGRYCFVVNDDTLMSMPVIDRLVRDFSLLPSDAAIVSPRILNPDGSLQLNGRAAWSAMKYVLSKFHLYREQPDDTIGKDAVFESVYPTSDITGACFMIKTGLFHRLGWFDERYYFIPEDIALSTLVRHCGYGVYVDGAADIVHKWHVTASAISPAVKPTALRGSLIFYARGSRLRYLFIGAAVFCAELMKFFLAVLRKLFKPTREHERALLVYRHNLESIFTRRTPKEVFLRYYRQK